MSKYFSNYEAFFLPSWGRLATPEDWLSLDVFKSVGVFLTQMDMVREYLKHPIIVHCCYRPPLYNKEIGGAEFSAHMCLDGSAAMDFHVKDLACDYVRMLLQPKLRKFKLRMEDRPNSGWVHLDNRDPVVGADRFFRP